MSSSVGEQLLITIPPPKGSEPPRNDIPLMVPLLLDDPLRIRQVPPTGPGPKKVSEISSKLSISNARDSRVTSLLSKSTDSVYTPGFRRIVSPSSAAINALEIVSKGA